MDNTTPQRQKLSVPPNNLKVAWSIAIVALLINIAGYAWNLYDRFWWYDEFLHFFTPLSLTLLIALYLASTVLIGVRDHTLLFILAAASLGIAVGVLWEVAEWAYDQLVPGNVILGKQDTINDLILDSLGALLAGWLSTKMIHTKRD
jgi:VanZ family protein